MQRLKIVLLVVFSGILFTVVFYKQFLGLNLLIFELFLMSALLITKKVNLEGRLELITFSGTILTALIVVIHNSALSITINIISALLFAGIITYLQLRNLSYAPVLTAYSIFKSQGNFIKKLSEGNSKVIAIIHLDNQGSDFLKRRKRRGIIGFKTMGLLNEYRTAVFLFVILNLLLLIVNSIDIYWVWFNFEWNGQYLKQFVHEGTYLLIFSILLSLILTLYFFRGNLNFLKKNRWLVL